MSEYTVALLFGGNIGDAVMQFDTACRKLGSCGFSVQKRSPVFRTEPVDCVPGTPDFQNQAVCGSWSGTAQELLALTQRIERESGRPACHSSREARTLDIDIILLGREKINLPELVIPHPRACSRDFVLLPMKEIAPEIANLLKSDDLVLTLGAGDITKLGEYIYDSLKALS